MNKSHGLLFISGVIIILPSTVLAHASGQGFVLLLPTGTMQWSGTLAVALSFTLLLFLPARFLNRLFQERTIARFRLPHVETGISLISLLFWGALVVAGYSGARDPLANPLSLTVWTLLWVGLTLACAVSGNLWSLLNPWSGPVRIITKGIPLIRLPASIGYAPAITGLLAFGWFEIVDSAPDDPARLATAVSVYCTLTFAAMVIFGPKDWLERGEFLHVFFGFIGRLAPLRAHRQDKVSVTVSFPGAGLIHSEPPSVSGALFILIALAIVSFDGASETWWWLSKLGINPLEFPGRSAVVYQNSIGLLLSCAVLSGAFILSVYAAIRLTGPPPPLQKALSWLVLSVIPIALAYHFAHYLIVLLINGQYALATASDPMAGGADWLGLGQFYVTTSFLNTQNSVELIWRVQSGAIIAGHIIAVCAAHRMAQDLWGDAHRAASGQIPLAALMVAYTFFGLWLLAQPTA